MAAPDTEYTMEQVLEELNLSNESRLIELDDIPYVVLINGIVSPILVGVTLLTNICVCLVLVRPNMRSATNTLLVAMAVSDTLTGICPLPAYFRFFSGGDGAHLEWVPYQWCAAFYFLTDHLPTIFHTASVWLTVALAAQRYVYVCHAIDARRWCTIENSLRAVAVIYVVAVLYQLCRRALPALPLCFTSSAALSRCATRLSNFRHASTRRETLQSSAASASSGRSWYRTWTSTSTRTTGFA